MLVGIWEEEEGGGDGQCAWAVDARRRIGSDKCIVDVYSRFHQSEKGQSVDIKKGRDRQ